MESRHITLDLGNVSLSETLGSYYIEMRPALVHYTNNIYRMWHGTGSS
jgi:heparosan-N-sulfate-glucuronate 5-epimerase